MTWAFETGVRTLWAEARGEPPEGQQAVAQVLWTRLRSGKWGSNLASVCLWPMQFSCWNLYDPNRLAVTRVPDDDPLLTHLRAVLTAAEHELDPTDGAMFYYAATIPPPPWTDGATFCGRFGHQMFYKDVR